jgi:hypothetical protein
MAQPQGPHLKHFVACRRPDAPGSRHLAPVKIFQIYNWWMLQITNRKVDIYIIYTPLMYRDYIFPDIYVYIYIEIPLILVGTPFFGPCKK